MNLDALIHQVLEWVGSIDPALRTLIAGVAIMLETSVLLGLVVPGDTVVIVASLAIDSWPWWLALIGAVVLGALVGESLGFWIGRLVGGGLRRWLDRRWSAGARRWREAERYLAARGGAAVFLSRFLPVAHSLVPVVAGAGGMPYRRFIAWTLPACLLWATAYATLGWLVGGTYRELSRTLHGAGYLLVGALVVAAVIVWLLKRVLARRERAHFTSGE